MPSMNKLCEAFLIFMQYNPDQLLEVAEHNIIYGPTEDDLEGLTEEDKEKLHKLGWNLDENGWYHYV
jgi:hypothetical protein